jgi:hypothetical protein
MLIKKDNNYLKKHNKHNKLIIKYIKKINAFLIIYKNNNYILWQYNINKFNIPKNQSEFYYQYFNFKKILANFGLVKIYNLSEF